MTCVQPVNVAGDRGSVSPPCYLPRLTRLIEVSIGEEQVQASGK